MNYPETYSVVRFYRDENHPENKTVVKHGLTLEEAQEHCQDPATKSSDGEWFDGFRKEQTS